MTDPNPNPNPSPSETPPGAPAAPAPAAPSGGELNESQIAEILNFDPFPSGGSKPDAPPSDPGTPSPPPPSEPAPTPAPAAPVISPEIEALQKELASLRQQLSQPPAAPAAPPATPPADEIPPYAFNMPQELLAALDSESPADRAKGYAAMLTGTARTVHKTIMDTVTGNLKELVTELPKVIQTHVTQALQAKAIFDDFYGTYKDLNVEELRPTIVMTARQVMMEKGHKSWTPAVKADVAKRVYALLGRAIPGETPLPATPPNGGYNPNGGVRGPVNPGLPAAQQDIINTIF